MHWQRWCSSEPVFRTLHPHPHPCPYCHAKTAYPRITRSPFTLHSPSPNVILCFFCLSLSSLERVVHSGRQREEAAFHVTFGPFGERCLLPLQNSSFSLFRSPSLSLIYLCILFYFSLFSRSTLYPLPAVVAAWQPVGQVAMVTAR